MQRLYTGSQYDVYPKWFNSYVIFGSPEIFVPLEWNCKSWNELSALKYGSLLPREVCASLSAERWTRTNKMAIQSYRCHNTSPRWIQMTKAVCIILQILELSLNYDQIFHGRFTGTVCLQWQVYISSLATLLLGSPMWWKATCRWLPGNKTILGRLLLQARLLTA